MSTFWSERMGELCHDLEVVCVLIEHSQSLCGEFLVKGEQGGRSQIRLMLASHRASF